MKFKILSLAILTAAISSPSFSSDSDDGPRQPRPPSIVYDEPDFQFHFEKQAPLLPTIQELPEGPRQPSVPTENISTIKVEEDEFLKVRAQITENLQRSREEIARCEFYLRATKIRFLKNN